MKGLRWIVVLLLTCALILTTAGCGGGDGDGNGGGDGLGDKYGTLFSSFSATDLQGNARDQSLVLDQTYTLVYLWATDCPPCVDSMPKLQAVHEAYQDKGVGVLGIVLDLQDSSGQRLEGKVADALSVAQEAGVTFPNLDIPPAVRDMIYNEVQYTPTAFFVDETGRIAGELMIGAYDYEYWSEAIEKLLEE